MHVGYSEKETKPMSVIILKNLQNGNGFCEILNDAYVTYNK